MRSVWGLLVGGLLAVHVLAASEYVHAYERIYFYANYMMEYEVYGRDRPQDMWIKGCRPVGSSKPMCSFNEVSPSSLPVLPT